MGGHLSTPTQPPTANSERRKSSGANACCWEGHLSSWQASRWGTQEVPPNNIRRSVHHQSASDLPPGPSGALLELSGQDHTFFLIYLFGRCWYAMTALSTPAATSHMLLFKIIKIKNFLKCSSYSYRPHSSALEPFIRQCTQGTPPSVQKAQDSNAVHFSPEDPFQKEAILNSPHSWSQRLVLFQRPIPSLVMWNFFQISTLITLSTYKISPLFSNISVFEKFSCDRNNS